MHLLKPEEILRIHDAVIERFGGLKTSPICPTIPAPNPLR